jgi:uncharacterized membrane protein
MDDLAIARALHVLGVVVWIGGVAMVTAVILPALRRRELGADPVAAFNAIERRFGHWARAAVLLVGATGFYMTAGFDLWDRFRAAAFWWMHAMLLVWLIFAFILFVAEPLFLHRRFDAWAAARPQAALAWLQRGHWLLLLLSLVAVLGAVAGSHGWSFG